VVASVSVVPGGVCIAGVSVVFSVLFLSACFSCMIVHFAVCAFVLLVSVCSSPSTSATRSATATATTTISAMEVSGHSGGCISVFFDYGLLLCIFADRIPTLLGHESGNPVLNDLDGPIISS